MQSFLSLYLHRNSQRPDTHTYHIQITKGKWNLKSPNVKFIVFICVGAQINALSHYIWLSSSAILYFHVSQTPALL